MGIRVVCMTSNRYSWAVEPFTKLFRKYWGEDCPVTIAGSTPPDFRLPGNFSFFQISSDDVPQDKYSDGLIKVLSSLRENHFILMLEDYWLCRKVDRCGLEDLEMAIKQPFFDTVLRFDLTSDRLCAYGDPRGAKNWGTFGHFDVIYTLNDVQYQFSFQAGLWNRKLLNSILVPGQTPWQMELYTVVPPSYEILGTRQHPIRYINACAKGQVDWDQVNKLSPSDLEMVKQHIPDDFKVFVP